MKHLNIKRNSAFVSWVQVAILVFASFAPFVMSMNRVDALEVEQRSIDMATSAPDAETSYTVSFVVPDTAAGTDNIGSFRVEFCDSSPIPNTTCTFDAVGDDIPQVDANAGSITTQAAATFGAGAQTISMTAPSVGDNELDFTLPLQEDINGQSEANRTFTVTLNDIDNPDNNTDNPNANNNQFYARVYVYSDTGNTTQVHEGGIALSTAEQITVTARVQETLDFCVGDTQAGTTCGDMSGTDIDLGVLSSGIINQASESVATTNATDTQTALAQVTTNAANGVIISYLATPLTADGTTSACGDVGSATTTDQCINEQQTQGVLTAGVEGWGLNLDPTVTDNGSLAGSELSVDADFAHNITNGGATFGADNNDYHVNVSAVSEPIASSTGVVDAERISIDAAATAQLTTPTGLYSSTLTFIATSTF